MTSKIRVYGKSQNRTALGIINAYLKLYPHATQNDLNKAFPAELNKPAMGASKLPYLLVTAKERGEGSVSDNFKTTFEEDPIVLQDGTKLFFVMLWQKPEFERIIEWSKQYGIEIAEFKPTQGFEKGGYSLEYLNGFVPAAPQAKKKKILPLIIIVLGAVVVLTSLFVLLKPKKDVVKEVEVEVETKEAEVDTVYIQELDEIEEEFNAIQFNQNSSELNEEAKSVLDDLAKLLNTKKDLKLRIVGHTSTEGDPTTNQKLSENRAKSAVDYLVKECNIEAERLQFEGKGSSEPIDRNNNEVNRRTEFIVIK